MGFRSGIEQAAGRFVALLLEHFVRDALFDVVGFAGKNSERLVLRLPAQAADGSCVAFPVRMAGDAQRPLEIQVSVFVVEDRGVLDGFNQAGSEHRCGNAENHVTWEAGKVRLTNIAARSVHTTGDGEEIMDTAVANRVGGRVHKSESRLSHRSVQGNETRHRVGGAIPGCHPDLRIYERARSARRRLCVAAAATVQIETRSKPRFGVCYCSLYRIYRDKDI